MVTFSTIIHKYGAKGEKSGWTYIDIPPDLIQELKSETKTWFRVKGKLDHFSIKQVALVPTGGGKYIMAINAAMRRGIRKVEGAQVLVEIEEDTSEMLISRDLIDCLEEEPKALKHFNTLTPGHQKYFSDWIESAKTIETKTRRIEQSVKGLIMGMEYGEMIRYFRSKQNL